MAIEVLVGLVLLIGGLAALVWYSTRSGANADRAGAASQQEATQAGVITKQQQMAQAEADAPRDPAGVATRANEGTF